MSDPRPLVYAINKFLRTQLNENKVAKEFEEGVEISIQCLEAAFTVQSTDRDLDVASGLQEIFQKYLVESEAQKAAEGPEPTAEDRAAADNSKTEGNVQMDSHNFEEAVACYTKAIKLDPKNPIYYCNRAAALNNLGKHEGAIQDCELALKLDPGYSKAYCRRGLAFSKMNKLQESVDSYKRAVELDPGNETHKANLKLAEDALERSRPSLENNNVRINVPQEGNMDSLNLTNLVSMMAEELTNNNEVGELIRQIFGRNQNPGNSSRNSNFMEH